MRNQDVGGRGIGIPRAGRGGDTALREPVRREQVAVPILPRRGRASGPRPVRPRTAAAPVRPVVPTCAVGRAVPVRPVHGAPARRVLRPVSVLPARILRRRRVAAVIGMALLTAVVVVLLGLLADVAAATRAGADGSDAVTDRSLTEVAGRSGQVVEAGSR